MLRVLSLLEARVLGVLVEKERTVPDSYPLTPNAPCCARATIDHAAALASPAMNSRRRIRDLPR